MKSWKTKEGKWIDLADMETSYIENCIRFLEKKIAKGDTIQKYSGGGVDGNFWYDEEDRTEEFEQDIRDFKLEILWRERRG